MSPDLTPQDWARDALGHGCFAVDLDGHVQAFHVSIRDALIARGVLTRGDDDVWRLHWHGWDLDRERAAWMACCDFCSARPVVWAFACADFAMPSVPGSAPQTSHGAWMACATCGAHVQGNRRGALLAHSQQTRIDALGLPKPMRDVLLRFTKELQRRFWIYYSGVAVPVTARPFGH